MGNGTKLHPQTDWPEGGERHVVEVPILDSAVVVHSTLMREVLDLVSWVVLSDANVLLTGESGVGKEVSGQWKRWYVSAPGSGGNGRCNILSVQ